MIPAHHTILHQALLHANERNEVLVSMIEDYVLKEHPESKGDEPNVQRLLQDMQLWSVQARMATLRVLCENEVLPGPDVQELRTAYSKMQCAFCAHSTALDIADAKLNVHEDAYVDRVLKCMKNHITYNEGIAVYGINCTAHNSVFNVLKFCNILVRLWRKRCCTENSKVVEYIELHALAYKSSKLQYQFTQYALIAAYRMLKGYYSSQGSAIMSVCERKVQDLRTGEFDAN